MSCAASRNTRKMIQARFVYTDYLIGEWTIVRPGGPMMVPNPRYAHRLLGVEFKTVEGEIPPKPRRHSGRSYRVGVTSNGKNDA
jgi:hypothetical protein